MTMLSLATARRAQVEDATKQIGELGLDRVPAVSILAKYFSHRHLDPTPLSQVTNCKS